MVRLTLKQCAYFVAVAEQGGIAKASRVLNISQPAIAQAIDKLEHLFKLQLLERHHAKGTELTLHGRAFLESARALLKQAAITEQNAYAIAADNAGIIRLACFHTIAPYYLPQIVNAYQQQYPQVEVAPVELHQDEIMHSIEAGEIDLAITYDMSLHHELLTYQTLVQLKPFLLVSDKHPLAAAEEVSLSEMSEQPYIMFEGPSSREYFEHIFSAHNLTPKISYRSKSMESVTSAVANGLGVSLAVMQPHCAATKNLVSIALTDNIAPLSIVLVRKKGALFSGQIAKISAFCQQFFKQAASGNKA